MTTPAALLLTLACAASAHPLDPLSADEISRAAAIIQESGKAGPDALFASLALREPPKSEVLAASPDHPPRREAAAVVYDRRANKTYEAVVDLSGGAVESWRERPGVQPAVLLSEFDAMPAVVKADARWQAALARRGLALDDVAVDLWAYGAPDSEHARKTRLLRALGYYKGKDKNFYARPVEGLSAVVNVNERRVERVLDARQVPVPPRSSELDERSLGPQRPPLKPLAVSQPQGPGFSVHGHEVSWDRWRLRFTMHPREGLILQQVSYDDRGRLRPVLYRASLSEMMVPYGDSDPDWTYRNAFDEGEYGIGRYSGSLSTGVDVPANASLFDAVFADDFGKPYVAKDVVAIYERPSGLLWKHFDMYNGGDAARQGRELVLGFITTVSNYDYGLNWVFRQDGSIELEAQLTGIMLAKGVSTRSVDRAARHHGGETRFAHLVAPGVAAPHHQHFFNFRLDFDVDGSSPNAVVELDAESLPPGPDNPARNAFVMSETPLKTERAARRDLDFAAQRKWAVVNFSTANALGGPTGFLLVPGESSPPYMAKDAAPRRRGGFIDHAFWATPYRDDELHAAGEYPNQRAAGDGLPVWTAKDRPLGGDVVVWYTFGITHAPRPEEWPVMPVYKAGFRLLPLGFFDRNPALDLPAE